MKAVFDTNILIDYLNGIESAAQELALYDTRIISAITLIEVLVGVRSMQEEKAVRGFLATFTVRDVSATIAEIAVRLRRDHRLKVPDAIVYATARAEECLLVSRNTKDFDPAWPDVRAPYRV
ncbi:MAG: type II toxin-antitoxin system VapC family toxin [Verrucomicrobiota bacterium JB022]|nr:type II toxin-antitoxin system VapC family toxin [Verrucomicrobiota bacterium JB022]